MKGSVLVIGGGISGMQAALDLAESGFYVYLLEESPAIGGKMAQLDKTFPTNDCAMCIMAPRLVDVAQNLNIQILTCSEVVGVDGDVGDFRVKIVKLPRYVDEEKCTGCRECFEKCPVKKQDEHNMGISLRRNIYIPYPQAVPQVAKIDRDTCTYFIKGKCRVCEKVCRAGAIDFSQKPSELELNVGAIVIATGLSLTSPDVREEYGYTHYKNVITSLEFERYLSASGPTSGRIVRPSDGREPKRICWIQCVGSRDTARPYCSSVCCMYATKEAIITREHLPETEVVIFFMDIRAFGKDFEKYYNRAREEYGVKYVRCIVSTVKQDPKTESLLIRYIESDKLKEKEFDLVVLSVGLRASEKVVQLSERVGIEIGQYGFCGTSYFSPITTSKRGVFIAGGASGPKDIPEAVICASGAASACGEILSSARGKEVAKKEYPPERELTGPARIGVFVCRCGVNIAQTVDVPKITEYAKSLSDVTYAEERLYMCSQDSQKVIKERIEEHKLNRIVVAACTPRTHEMLFADTIREAGLNRYLFEMANIRDQCSWVHRDRERATEKAKELLRMSIARSALLEPLYHKEMRVVKRCLVIGGGISGMTSALSLADAGFCVELVEKEAELGGNMRSIHFVLNGEDPQRYLNEVIEKVKEHRLINLHLESEIASLSGHIGHFNVEISNQKSKPKEIEVGAIIVATGGIEYKPTEYLYGKDERIITQTELERRISDLKTTEIKSVVMIQCVGSRREERPYCSRVCCAQAVKNALKIKELWPDTTEVFILYRDIRTYGFLEEHYQKAREAGVIFIRYTEDRMPEVREDLVVEVFDLTLAEELKIPADLVVLSPAILANPDNRKIAELLKVPLTEEGFFLEAHMKLRPVDFATEGIFLCGLCHSPKSIPESIAQAMAAAGRVATLLSKDTLSVGGAISVIDQEVCIACLTCIRVCPYSVPSINAKGVAEIEPAKCQGCGICAAECPAKAIQLLHYKDSQMLAKTEAIFGGRDG